MTQDEPRWVVYPVNKADAFGYSREGYGVREEYADGATRCVHDEVFEDLTAAEKLASKFNISARKGMSYDNAMKRWR